MPQEFDEVLEDDFLKIGGPQPSFIQIEYALMQLAGGGVKGTKFKESALKAAGWDEPVLNTYAHRPDKACSAFNKIRAALAHSDDPDEIINHVSA